MSIRRLITLIIVAISFWACAAEARAGGLVRVVVIPENASSAPVAESLRTSLGARYSVDDASVFRRTMAREWDGVKLLDALASERRPALITELQRVAIKNGTGVVLLVGVRPGVKPERGARVALLGQRSAPFEMTAKLQPNGDGQDDALRLYAELDLPIQALEEIEGSAGASSLDAQARQPPAEPSASSARSLLEARSGEPSDSPASAPASPDPGRVIEHALLVLEPHLGVGTRKLEYVDRVSPNQRSYALGGAPLVGVSAEVNPFATMSGAGLLAGLGVAAGYDRALLLQSGMASAGTALRAPGVQDVDTSWSNFDIAVHSRVTLGQRVVVGANAGYGRLDFSFGGPDALHAQLPGVAYRFIRVGLDARVPVWVLTLTAGLDYLAVSDAGDLSARYPHASAGGVDARFGVALPLMNHVEARTGLRYQRFFHSFHPDVGAQNVAGGALDELARWDSSVAVYY